MDHIAKLLDSAEADSSKLVSIAEQVLHILEAEKLAYRARLPPKVVGVHPQNRGGWGVTPAGVHRLGFTISSMGFVPKETWHAVCIEDDTDGAIAEFTQKMFDSAEGLLGTTAADVKYGSVSCSHTNMFLVAVLAAARTEYDSMAAGGKLSYSKLSEDQHLKDALDNGLTWLIISAKAIRRFKNLPQLIQAARNATGAAHQREDAFQVLHQVQCVAASMAATKQTVDWDQIRRVVGVRTQCAADDMKPLIDFAQKFGGGSTTSFVDDLARFHKLYVPPGRIVPGTTWRALADLRISVSELCPYFVYGVIKCQASCPKDKCDGNVAKFISPSEISTLATTRKAAMLKAEKVLSECRMLAKTVGALPEVCSKAIGRLDILIVRIVLDKKGDSEDMASVAKKFMEEIGHVPVDKGSVSSSVATPNVVQYDEDGRPVAGGALMLRTEGFEVGTKVKCDGACMSS